MLARPLCVGLTTCPTEQRTLYGKERAGGAAGGEDAPVLDDADATRRTLSGHPDRPPPLELALQALREALVTVVSEPVVRAYLRAEFPALYEQVDEAMRLATGLRAVEHAAAERDRWTLPVALTIMRSTATHDRSEALPSGGAAAVARELRQIGPRDLLLEG
jgi:hypothetical protein